MIYIYFTTFLYFITYLFRNDQKLKNQIYFVILFIFFLLTAYRYQVGCDWYGYYRLFIRFENYDLTLLGLGRDAELPEIRHGQVLTLAHVPIEHRSRKRRIQ